MNMSQFKALKNTINKFWPPLEYPLVMTDVLKTQTKDQLTRIRMHLGISGASSLNKDALIAKLEDRLPVVAPDLFSSWDMSRVKLIRKIVNGQGRLLQPLLEVQQYSYFRDRGLLFPATVDDKRALLMPTELVDVFKGINEFVHMQTIKRNTEMILLARGLLYYYGALNQEDMGRFLHSLMGSKQNDQDYIEVLSDATFYYDDISIVNGNVYKYQWVENVDDVFKEQALRPNLEFCSFTKEQLLQAGESDYVERGKPYMDMLRYFDNHYELDRDEADLLVDDCVDTIRNGKSLQDVLELLQETIELPDERMMPGFMGRLVPLMNGTKQWGLKGYSPDELASVSTVDGPAPKFIPVASPPVQGNVFSIQTARRIGRNDMCPCGSGKKYKKCCMS
ncbi:hypothetical protein EBB07_24810 [Paenibacillaceae bacterium]|nr:hypothetical protein EBB07_24810 [Paenibacillaceae bacterium]